MKKKILIVAGLALLVAGYVGTRSLLAQGAAGGGAPAAFKIAVVDIDGVFSKYEKAQFYKRELDKEIAPLKTDAEKYKKDYLAWQEHLKLKGATLSQAEKDQGTKNLVELKRRLEDLDAEARRRIGKKQEDQLVQLYKEVVAASQAYGQANGFTMVLGYGEPFQGTDFYSFANISRRMQGMGLGMVPIWYNQNLDITAGIIETLNQHYRSQGGVPATPTSGSGGKN